MEMDDKRKLDEIYTAIVGSELHPNGLLNRVEKLEQWASNAKRFAWIGTGIFIAGSAIIKLLRE